MYFYLAYGLSIKSCLPLPELSAGRGKEPAVGMEYGPEAAISTERDPDIIVVYGSISEPPVELSSAEHHAWAVPGGLCLYWQGIGIIALLHGNEIKLDLVPEVEESRLRLFILGVAIAVLLHQRGLLVLHASAVAVNGKAAVFLGNKGWGKSTMAAALAMRGHSVISDDVVALGRDESGRPTLLPAFPQIKLWPNSVKALGGNPEELPRLSTLFDKRHYDVSAQFARTPLPLERIFLLDIGETVKVGSVQAQDAIVELIRHSYSARFATHLLSGKEGGRHLLQCSALARCVPVCRLERPVDLALLPNVADLVEETLPL